MNFIFLASSTGRFNFFVLFRVYCVTVKNEPYNNDDGDDEEDAKDHSSYQIQSCRNVT